MKAAAEVCDGTDIGGATCATAASPGWNGIVTCTPQCRLNIAGCSTPPTTWNAMTADKWSLFNMTPVTGAAGSISNVFDGRYIYFVPYGANPPTGSRSGIVARYDTQNGFASSDSWSHFDLATVNPAAIGFLGGAFDGRYVYFIPLYNAAYHGTVARYDTKGDFTAGSSWKTFDVSSVNPTATGFANAAFDGRYLYLAPYTNNGANGTVIYSSTAARYDTQAEFGQMASWTTFDTSTLDASARGFLGAAFDGRYVYLIPHYNGTAYHGIVPRFDTRATTGFTSKDSWTTFNTATVAGSPVGFLGTAFDGRYIYMVQYRKADMSFGALVARYDTQADFKDATNAWSTFDAATLAGGSARGFWGAKFDGRYLYLVPFENDFPTGTTYDGIIARYDTTASFGAPSSWSTLDLTVALNNPSAAGFNGAGFDGRYLYLSPRLGAGSVIHGNVARFDAKSPSWLPVGWNHAFN